MSGREPNLLRWEVSGVDSGPQPQPKKGIEMGGRTLAGTQPSFLIWYMHEWTGLRPYLGISGGLTRHGPYGAQPLFPSPVTCASAQRAARAPSSPAPAHTHNDRHR